MILLIQLFLAHILGDFFLQPDKWVREKTQKRLRSIYLYIHVVIHFLLILLVTGDTGLWKIALLISLSHLVIDGIKLLAQKEGESRAWFFADQLLHLAVLLTVWIVQDKVVVDLHALWNRTNLILITAVLFLLNPASIIIKTVISKWTPGAPGGNEHPTGATANIYRSLENAGQLIGMIERVLVLIFIFVGRWEGVGFLLAAKSVFRFGDLKDARDTKLTEYVLIGTLLSFGMAVITSLLAVTLWRT
ncbi:MAG: DUF3307 domain-containing protein [Bacteroidota bacterium]|nr:DUF3307 domain-containing protein [Bacteroidota bacterium]MDP4217338.1 DUF3307 domain-containing protein [Bacteroidota bacterium]MDP4245777.1 DUF3307 domain-containing protein [Bacteroidota bacterium]MDP4253564.1 DUF3307 domain-containing protein [Bacteroidota bacterium]MDP4257077.1 DUF3307 domain-containing protein [Bacteroidota bacterium]